VPAFSFELLHTHCLQTLSCGTHGYFLNQDLSPMHEAGPVDLARQNEPFSDNHAASVDPGWSRWPALAGSCLRLIAVLSGPPSLSRQHCLWCCLNRSHACGALWLLPSPAIGSSILATMETSGGLHGLCLLCGCSEQRKPGTNMRIQPGGRPLWSHRAEVARESSHHRSLTVFYVCAEYKRAGGRRASRLRGI